MTDDQDDQDAPDEVPEMAGLPDLDSLLGGLSSMQELQDAEFEGSAGGGLVKVRANGRMDVHAVEISPAALDGADAELLSDLVLAALHDLTARIAAAQKAALGSLGDLLGGQ
ncbi:MAG: YbaB/EbfC family nucleoid-associated protein [Acidimicrobiales bacterium]